MKYKDISFFDIDETVFNTFAKVRVLDPLGRIVKELSNAEFNSYKKEEGETFDFSDFTSSAVFKGSSIIIPSTLKQIKTDFTNGNLIVFLTARADFDSNSDVKRVFGSYGIKVNDSRIRFELSGNLKLGTIPEKKRYVIEKFINKYSPVTVSIYDDHKPNIDIANALRTKYPDITFKKFLVVNGIIHDMTNESKISSFNTFLIEAAVKGKNLHLTHIQDLVIYGGVDGTRQAINALRSLRDMLKGSTSKSVNVTEKFDGAPAIFAGVDPSDGKFFVAKKGIFNKNPKVYKSHSDIDADTSGDLSTKLKTAFTELKDLGITDVIQGDIMFTKSDKKIETIDGDKYVTFHPNTIVYAVPVDSVLGKTILDANIGIVFHTTYTGTTFENMSASFSVNLSTLKKKKSIWYQDASVKNLSGTVTLTTSDVKEIDALLSEAGSIFRRISSTTLKQIEEDETLSSEIETFNNSNIRGGSFITDAKSHASNLVKWMSQRYTKDIEDKKSDKGKASATAKKEERMKFFSPENISNLELIFQLQKNIYEAKIILINKLSKINSLSTFIKTSNGYKVTKSEGFVAIDTLSNNAVKLVDQLEFSYANFSPEVIKGWQR